MRFLLLSSLAASSIAQPFPSKLFDALEWRMIGPFRGGRVLAVSGVPGDPNKFYFGSVGGGVWKTTNAGLTWAPIFDSQPIASIGAIAVAPSDANTIYVGTGEADMRSDIAFGDGVYKSTDGGETWRNVGLRDSRQIGKILVDPRNPDIVYVAALGHAYGSNAERGVYRSTDGGGSWRKVLDKGPDTGAIDLAADPGNPRVIYAAMWRARRTPWSQYPPQGGAGSALFKTTDGGDHWIEINGAGLPGGEWGRVGLAAAGGGIVYAEIDTASGGLFRSNDAGGTWARVGSDPRIGSRGWYFSGVTVDPNNPETVYMPNVAVYRSTDGGRNFTVLKGAPGGDDYHTLWIDPSNSSRMILGVDQGATISVDGGKTWTSWYNQPTAQLYHVTTDNRFPYSVYGSQQDSGTAAVSSRTDHGSITERDFRGVGGAESGYIAVDPKDPNIVYVNDTYGKLTRFDQRTSQGQIVTPWASPAFTIDISQRKFRHPWTSPLVFSATEPNTLYFGAQSVLKTTDGGLNWLEISPDLTGDARKNKNAGSGPVTIENAKQRGYGVVYTIAPSPLKAGMIWVGSDTGLIHLTRDGGKSWANISPKGLSDWSRITHIEPSHFDPAEAWAAVDRHRLDDYEPHLYRTRDYGQTWTELVSGLEKYAFLNAVREDPARKGLLFAATELGVSVSFDDAQHWQSLKLNLPTVSVRDLVIHGDDLVIATHGRSFWILDDMSPLREIDSKIAAASVHFYKPSTAIRMSPEGFSGTPLPPEIPAAKNPPDGAMLDYYLTDTPAGEVTLEILDQKGQLVRKFSTNDRSPARPPLAIADIWLAAPPHLTAKPGMNRFVWDLRYSSPTSDVEDDTETGRPQPGPRVLPGSYQARLTAPGSSLTQPVKVVLDPRSAATPADLAKQFELGMKIAQAIRRCAEASAEAGRAKNQEILRGLSAVRRELSAALDVVSSADRTPPAQAYALFGQARKNLETQLAAWNRIKAGRPQP